MKSILACADMLGLITMAGAAEDSQSGNILFPGCKIEVNRNIANISRNPKLIFSRGNPQGLHERLTSLAIEALQEVWPCK